jgi:hypothetical protein
MCAWACQPLYLGSPGRGAQPWNSCLESLSLARGIDEFILHFCSRLMLTALSESTTSIDAKLGGSTELCPELSVCHRVTDTGPGLFQGYILGSMIRLNIPNSRSPKDRMINAVRIDLISKRELMAISTRTVAKNTVIIM